MLAYSMSDRPGTQDRYIYTFDAETRKQNAIVTMAGVNTRPIWTPDGAELFFILKEGVGGPTWRMMRIPAAGGMALFDGLDSAKFTGPASLPAYEVATRRRAPRRVAAASWCDTPAPTVPGMPLRRI
jgi:hypothetical protein